MNELSPLITKRVTMDTKFLFVGEDEYGNEYSNWHIVLRCGKRKMEGSFFKTAEDDDICQPPDLPLVLDTIVQNAITIEVTYRSTDEYGFLNTSQEFVYEPTEATKELTRVIGKRAFKTLLKRACS